MSLSSRSSSSSEGGGGVRGEMTSQSQPRTYFAYRHPPGVNEPPAYFNPPFPEENNYVRDNRGNRKAASVSVDNGAINLHIPCAFSYAYNVPVPPQPEEYRGPPGGRKPKPSRLQHRTQKLPTKTTKKGSITSPKDSECPLQPPPFCGTVKSGQFYKASKVPQTSSNSRTQNKISVVWDMHAGERINFQAVDYGQELYEQAARNLAKQLEEQKLEEKKMKRSGSVLSEIEDNCFDFSKPGINSTKHTARALEKAIENLKNLPSEVDSLLRKDPRFEPIVGQAATKVLNVGRSEKVYKDLIPVDPNPDVKTEAENVIQAEIKRSIEAAKPPSRTKDPEPRIEDFQSNSYTRIRPAPVPAPPKPPSGTSVEQNHDFDTIEEENELEDVSNRI